MRMPKAVRTELTAHVVDTLQDYPDDLDDLHQAAFNESLYLIGYGRCEQWLEEHGISPFQAIDRIQEYETEMFGETHTDVSSSENVVNMLTYIWGEELIGEMNLEQTAAELLSDIE